jgi:uncharacterized membrane protein YbaN (DUF454 family)
MTRLRKPVFLAIGWISVGLAVLGIILPLLPTTPMLIVAVWAFSRSSPELAERIRAHPRFGPYVRDWQDFGVIPLTGKILASLMMGSMATYLLGFSGVPWWGSWTATAIMAAAAIYVWSRPTRRPAGI